MKQIDFTPIADIKPVTGTPGYCAFTEEEGDRLREFYRTSGATHNEIGKALGCAGETVRNAVLRRHKFGRPRLFTEELVLEIHARHMAGESLKNLSVEFKDHVGRHFKRFGLPVRYRDSGLPERDRQVSALLKEGMQRPAIEEKLGLSKQQVIAAKHRIQARYSLKRKSEREQWRDSDE